MLQQRHFVADTAKEEIERLRAERKAKKLAEIADLQVDDRPEPTSDGKLGFLPRQFQRFDDAPPAKHRRLKVFNWNVLAQALVRASL